MSTRQRSHNNSTPSSSHQNDSPPPNALTHIPNADGDIPRKKAKLSSSSVQSTDNRTASPKVAITPSFLSFPEEVLLRIFEFLQAFKTNGAFEKPRHAFALALTNTRLLHIFRSHLTRITPDMCYSDIPTVQSPHILSVLRLSEGRIRELQIPGSWDVLPHLLDLCPQFEKLSIRSNFPFSPLNMPDLMHFLECAEGLIPQLSSLSIEMPDPRCLRFLVPPPSELILKNILGLCIKTLIPILRDPPKKLYFEFKDTISEHKPAFMAALREACPKMEELTLFSRDLAYQHRTVNALEEALKVLNVSRDNQDSKCMKMKIKGDFMEMFQQAHPNAVLEFSLQESTFCNVESRVYPTDIPLLDQYLTQDLSRLQAVSIPGTFQLNLEWKERLSGMNLSFMKLVDLNQGAAVCQGVKVKVLEIVAWQMHSEINWGFLKYVKKVRVMGSFFQKMNDDDIMEFLKSFADLLHTFRGECVSVHDFPVMLQVWDWNSSGILPAMRILIHGMRVFDARGGDASSVKAWAFRRVRYGIH